MLGIEKWLGSLQSQDTALASGTNKLTGYSVAKDSAAGWDSTNNRYVIPENGDYDIFHTIYHNTPSLATVPAFRTIRGVLQGRGYLEVRQLPRGKH